MTPYLEQNFREVIIFQAVEISYYFAYHPVPSLPVLASLPSPPLEKLSDLVGRKKQLPLTEASYLTFPLFCLETSRCLSQWTTG